MRREKGISESNNFLTKEPSSVEFDSVLPRKYSSTVKGVHIPADTRSAFPVISVQSPVSIQCCWQS